MACDGSAVNHKLDPNLLITSNAKCSRLVCFPVILVKNEVHQSLIRTYRKKFELQKQFLSKVVASGVLLLCHLLESVFGNLRGCCSHDTPSRGKASILQWRVRRNGIVLRMVTLLLLSTVQVCADPTRKPSPEPTQRPTGKPTAVPSFLPTTAIVSPFTFSFTGTEQYFMVPVNVTSITVTLYGGSGWEGSNAHGRGAMLSSVIPVIPGEVLLVMVGSAPTKTLYKVGGFNGGGYGATGGGGGATDIRRFPYALETRVLIAGGGGGFGYYADSFGGDGGVEATNGRPGSENRFQDYYGRAGGDVLEDPTCAGIPASPGPLGFGCDDDLVGSSGGGGGGYYGGGTGVYNGGGGGGSSYSLYSVIDQEMATQ